MGSKKQAVGYWTTEDGGRVSVSKSGRSYWIRFGDYEHLCHPSIRGIDDTRKEAVLVFHVKPVEFQYLG